MRLLQEEVDRKPALKAFVVYMGGDARQIEQLAAANRIERIGVMQVPVDDASLQGMQLRPVASLRNAIFLYKKRTVEKKFVNLKLDATGSRQLREALSKLH